MLGKLIGFSDHSLIKEQGNVVVIQDTLDQSGRSLVKTIIKSLVNHVDEVHVFLYELQQEHISKGLEDSLAKIHCHTVISDALGWNSIEQDPYQLLSKIPNMKVAVVVDSLSRQILDKSCAYTCQLVNRIAHSRNGGGHTVQSVVCLVHADLHPPHVLHQLLYTSDVTLTVRRPSSASAHKRYNGQCSILVKKPSGKVVKSEELYLISSDFQLVRADPVCDVTKHHHVTVSQEETKQSDPAANLTFNLRLTNEEKMARSKVQLPYTLDPSSKAAELDNPSAAGKIFYQPDDVDDWDEEDPDDDLDI